MRISCHGIQFVMTALVSTASLASIVLVTCSLSSQTLLARQNNEASVQADPQRFDGECVIRTQIQNQSELAFMLQLAPDVWSESAGIGPVDFRLATTELGKLDERGLSYEVLIPDVQALLDAENARQQQDFFDWFDNYRDRNEVNDYLDTLVDLRPDLARPIDLGNSVQGRPIRGLHITGPGGGADKPGVFLNGCQHAREWATVMTAMYIADQLIREYDNDPAITALVDNLDFYIVPIVNPDGYEYTWTNNRFWRKNRREGGGVDLNRNWSYGWGGPGSSDNPSSETYRGTKPFSEPETSAVRDFVFERPSILYHNDIHMYSQLILQPWGWTRDLPPDHATFDAMGQAMQDAVYAVHGKTYVHGPIFTTIYPASGVMSDWFYGARDAFSVSYELRDRGQYGFLLPADQILPTCEEAFAGIIAEVTHSVPWRMKLDIQEPALWGGMLRLRTARATAGEKVYFFYSLKGVTEPGKAAIPQLNVVLNLRSPRLLDQGRADAAGMATLARPLPNYKQFRRVFFQAAEMNRVTNFLMVDIPAR